MRQVPATYVSDFSRYVSWVPSTVFRLSFRKCCLATPFMLHNYWIMTYLVFTITTVECWNLSIGLHAQRCRQNESEQLFSYQPARNYCHKFIHHNKTFINHCTFVQLARTDYRISIFIVGLILTTQLFTGFVLPMFGNDADRKVNCDTISLHGSNKNGRYYWVHLSSSAGVPSLHWSHTWWWVFTTL